jgi:hypothetical protein
MIPRFNPGVNPEPEQLFCPVPTPTLPLVSMRTFFRTACSFPRPDPEQLYGSRGPNRGGPERRRRIASANPQKP